MYLPNRGEHQGLLGLEHLQAAQEDPAQTRPDDAHDQNDHRRHIHAAGLILDGGPHDTHNRQHIQGQNEQQHGHTLFLAG